MAKSSKYGCLSRLLFVAAVATFFFVLYSHSANSYVTVSWQSAKTPILWMLGLALFFKLISPRRKQVIESSPDFTVKVEGVEICGRDDSNLATVRQLEYIKALGGNPKNGMTMSEASALIDELKIEHDIKQREEVERRLDARRQSASKRFKKVTPSESHK